MKLEAWNPQVRGCEILHHELIVHLYLEFLMGGVSLGKHSQKYFSKPQLGSKKIEHLEVQLRHHLNASRTCFGLVEKGAMHRVLLPDRIELLENVVVEHVLRTIFSY